MNAIIGTMQALTLRNIQILQRYLLHGIDKYLTTQQVPNNVDFKMYI